jgi:hypothetical protein
MQIKVGATLYPFPSKPLELGEQRRLKHEYGMVPGRDEFDLLDPDHLGAFLYAAMREADPDTPGNTLISRINRVREIEVVGDDGKPIAADEPGLDPTPAPPTPTQTTTPTPAIAEPQSDDEPPPESESVSS